MKKQKGLLIIFLTVFLTLQAGCNTSFIYNIEQLKDDVVKVEIIEILTYQVLDYEFIMIIDDELKYDFLLELSEIDFKRL